MTTGYFRGSGGIAWNTYGPGLPQTPSLTIPYPAGVVVGDLLVLMSYRYITEASLDLSHWNPMTPRGGYTPTPFARQAYWAIADASDVAAGTIDVVCNWVIDEYHMNAVHGLMCAWKGPRIGFTFDDFLPFFKLEANMPYPAWTGLTGDIAMAVGLAGANYHDPPYTPPTFSWGAFTEEFQQQDTLTHDYTSTLPPSTPATLTENASYGAASYVMVAGAVPSTSFTTSTTDPAGGDGRFVEMLQPGVFPLQQGYWGILASKL